MAVAAPAAVVDFAKEIAVLDTTAVAAADSGLETGEFLS